MKCEQCFTDIVTCFRCRKKHCYHHYCPEQDGFNIVPPSIWSETVNQEKIRKTEEAFKKK